MRPIDADRLKAVLEKNFGHTGGASVLEQLIDEQPTIEPSTNCSEIPNSSDTISRQAAIDALHTWFRDGFDEDKWWNSTHVLAAIEGLHPVQQEHKWETCFECPLSHGCPKIKGCTNEQAIEYASQIPNDCPLSAQPESCKGCIQYGLWENEIEYGLPSPCTRCKRRANDNYEGRFNQQTGSN